MNVIFLDIDGVLNSETWAHAYGWGRTLNKKEANYKSDLGEAAYKKAKLNPASVYILNEICKKNKAKVVITSTWRFKFLRNNKNLNMGSDIGYWNSLFKHICNTEFSIKSHIEVIDFTPELTGPLDNRGMEILTYNYNTKYIITKFVVLDDIDDGISNFFRDNLVLIDDNYGLGLPHVELINKILK